MELNKFHEDLISEINENRQITASTFEEEFFNTYVSYLTESDEIIGDTNYLYFEIPLVKKQRASISGYSYNEEDGMLSLILVDNLNFYDDISTLSTAEADKLYKRAKNFFVFANEISKEGEESSEAVNIAYSIANRKRNESEIFFNLQNIKIFILTDKKLSKNILQRDVEIVDKIKISTQFVGIERVFNLSESRKGKEDLEVDLTKFETIPAILANETNEYESYLCNINGLTLAKLYNEYGSRLIESNVRSFLQTRGNVNKGIRLTILKEPEKFFAYNNGLTCTAKFVEYEGGIITKIIGLQIVNGGQTTASLANVLLNDKGGEERLLEVSVPMKLNVIKNEEIEDEFVADISKYANSQNKVSDVDLASNHPFHKKFEQLSRTTPSPASDGFSHGTYWYYERAAGQYAQETYKMPKSQKDRFQLMNPKKQMFKKSDLAKYFNIYNKQPDIASKGGVAAFKNFSAWIINVWDKNQNSVNQEFYKEMISNIIMFKELDIITKKGAGANGYKANINAYTLSYLYWYIESKLDMKFDSSKIWQKQSVPQNVLNFMDKLSYKIRDVLTDTEGNVTEYAKRQYAWAEVKNKISVDNHDLSNICMSKEEAIVQKQTAKKDEKFNSDINVTTYIYKKLDSDPNYYKNLLIFIDKNNKEFLPMERNIVASLATNKYLTDKQCKVAYKAIEKAELEGFGVVLE